jgi:hydroxyacylglutathione hydrolase
VTTDQPDTPAYFTYDAILNTREHPTLDEALERELRPLSLERLLEMVQGGAQLLDTRESTEFEGAHIRGALNIGLGGSFASWSGTILDRDRPVVVIAEPGRELEAATRLGRIGFDTVVGYLEGGMQTLEEAPELIDRIERITAGSLAEQLVSSSPPLLVDVRSTREWDQERIDGAVSLPLSQLRERLHELPSDCPLVVHCAGGYRSAIAASLLRREGLARVADLVGGIGAWEAAQLAIVAGGSATGAAPSPA